jgi:hypothetical protein
LSWNVLKENIVESGVKHHNSNSFKRKGITNVEKENQEI